MNGLFTLSTSIFLHLRIKHPMMVMVMAKPVIYTQTMNVYHNIVRYRPRTTEEKRSAEEKGQVNCHALSYSPMAIIGEYTWENDFALIEKNTEYFF